jgi:G3E family GTPase
MSFAQLVALMEEVGGPALTEGTPLDAARDKAWRFVERTFSDSHDHSHDHDHSSSTAGERFGIGSFVYEARRPFEPSRLARVVAALPTASERRVTASAGAEAGAGDGGAVEAALRGVLRSKGFMWLASSPSSAFHWSHAGSHFETQLLGRWSAVADDFKGDDGDRRPAAVDETSIPDGQKNPRMAGFDGDDGDRRQEIVFIGTGLEGAGDETATNRETITTALDRCLLTDSEMERYRSVQHDAHGCESAFPNQMQVRVASLGGRQHDPIGEVC